MNFTGLMVPPVTPTHANGELNLDVIPQYVDYLLQNEVHGVYVCGTTGEGLAFNLEERKKIAEAWLRSGKNKLKSIVIQVGGFCLKDTKELAAHAEINGADAIASLPPLYHKPSNVDELVDYCKEVASAASKTPFLYYHIPFLTDVNFSICDFLDRGASRIPNLAGAKFTSVDLYDLANSCALMNRKFTVFNGFDEYFGLAMVAGCRAGIGATYNFAPQFTTRIIKAFGEGKMEEFRKEQERLTQLVQILRKHDRSIALFKAVTDLVAPFPVGPPRLPLRPLAPAVRQALAQELKELGISVRQNKI